VGGLVMMRGRSVFSHAGSATAITADERDQENDEKRNF
jgi:hypothetical protein